MTGVFGSRVPDNVRDVCALDCRNWVWRPQVKISYLAEQREIAAVFSMEHVSLRTETDPTVLVACERSSLSHKHIFLLAHGERSKCARGVRMQQSFPWNMSVCARSEIQVCSQRENAEVFLTEHVSLRTETDPSVLVACERSSVVA